LVNRFGETRSETRRTKVGGLKGLWGGAASPLLPDRGYGERCKLPSGIRGGDPAAKWFSRILNTQDDLSGQQDDGPRRFYFFGFQAEW